jgi:hypothetical protein
MLQCVSGELAREEVQVVGELKEFSGLDGGRIGNIQVIPKPSRRSKRISFGDIELYRKSCPLELIHNGVGLPAFERSEHH